MERNFMKRIETIFAGHVQGVGFRYTTQRIASDFSVTGFVKNLADGTVIVIAEGTPAEIDRFLKSLNERMDGYIRESKQQELAATHEFADFVVQR